MAITTILSSLMQVIVEEAARNEAFAKRLEEAIAGEATSNDPDQQGQCEPVEKRSTHRDPAVLDPIEVIGNGKKALTGLLEKLSEKELKDIIADYRLDPSSRAMSWRRKDRLMQFIVDVAERRAAKGDAFRERT